MTLADLPVGSGVLIDANILIYARRGVSAQCRHLLERCAAREVTGVLTTIILAEFCHRRMMQEAQSRGLVASNPAKALDLQRQQGLLTNDSLNLAAGWRAGVTQLATLDPQFDTVPGITVFKPDDVS